MVHSFQGEESLLEKQIKEIADTGVKVIVAGAKFGDMALHFLNKYGIMGVRLNSKFDLRRLAKTVNAVVSFFFLLYLQSVFRGGGAIARPLFKCRHATDHYSYY